MNQFLIANAQRCIGCRTCEVACAVAHQQAQDVAALSTNHFAPRIRVVKSGEISTAMACRQCEDAPCASVCPQGRFSATMTSGGSTSGAASAAKAAWWPARTAR